MQISFKEKRPTLYIVATPIGNLEDITLRALNTLKAVAVVFAEDTRVSAGLLNYYNIDTKLISYYEERKYEKIDLVMSYLNEGLDIALVSDAGTPGISDPGFELINAVIEAGYYVVSIPGAVASIAALTTSGLLMQPHLFVGFLPRKQSEIISELKKYEKLAATLIFYESPNRVKKTLNYLYEVYGDRRVVLARELTKLYETITRSTLAELKDADINIKGEYVILVEGFVKPEIINPNIIEYVDKYIEKGYTEKAAMKAAALELNISKKLVYQKYKIEK